MCVEQRPGELHAWRFLLSSPHGGAGSAGSCIKQHTQSIASQGSLGVWNFYWNLVT